MKFSETLIDLRKENNLSQQQLANATGLSRSAIAKSEKGRNEATASTLLRLSRFFGVSVDEMLSETEPPHPQSLVDATFPDAESELIESFRKLSENGKARAAAYVNFLVRQESDRKNRGPSFPQKSSLIIKPHSLLPRRGKLSLKATSVSVLSLPPRGKVSPHGDG